MKFISGKKLQMTQIWVNDKVIGVTPVMAGPCVITQIKNTKRDGYEALQLAYGTRKEKNINKPQLTQYKALGVKPSHVREFRLTAATDLKIGDTVTVGTFEVGDSVNISGTSKGKGFQGVVKRHHFAGFRATHGNKDQERMPGSIGPKGPAHVFKGTRMAGRMGGERVTTTNLEIVKIDEENNTIFIKGSVPGAINGFVTITGNGELKVNLRKEAKVEEVVEEKKEEIVVEETPIVGETPITEEKVEEVKEAAEVAKEEVKEEVVEENKELAK